MLTRTVKPTIVKIILFLFISVVNYGCQPIEGHAAEPPAITGDEDEVAVITQESVHQVEFKPEPISAAVEMSVPDEEAGISPENDQLPVATPIPLVFESPENGFITDTAWRPPLYPVPWAPTEFDHFYFTHPIAANENKWILEDYRYGGVFFGDEVHTGVDIPAPPGTEILAAQAGKVIWADYGLYSGDAGRRDDPYGIAIVIKHDFGFHGETLFTVYGHLDKADVVRGQIVRAGEHIGLVGETGHTTGPHLHFEVRVGESDYFRSLNPELWLVPPEGWGVLAVRMMNSWGDPLYRQRVKVENLETGQIWRAKTYGRGSVNADPYYQENMVVSDLPAGHYEIRTPYIGLWRIYEFDVYPGRVTFLTMSGYSGFAEEFPEHPGEGFDPISH